MKKEEYLKEKLLLSFAEWLQFNGKWNLPSEQVKLFLKENK